MEEILRTKTKRLQNHKIVCGKFLGKMPRYSKHSLIQTSTLILHKAAFLKHKTKGT